MAILILGATSEIARENVEIFAGRGERVILAARNLSTLRPPAGASAQSVYYDAEETFQTPSNAEMFWRQCVEIARANWEEDIDGVYIAQGFLPSAETDRWGEEIEKTIFLNFTSLTFFLEAVAQCYEARAEKIAQLEPKRKPWITVISSVAGERGRLSNYPYGAAKAGLTAYLSGLRARLFHVGVHVLTVKPGLVQTKMIAGRPQEHSKTVARPKQIATDIDCAILRRKDTLYTPKWWRLVMFCVRMTPEWLFKRMKF